MTLPPDSNKRLLKDVKKQAIYEALKRNKGNKTRSAKDLGICIKTLRHMTNYDPMFEEFKKVGPGQRLAWSEVKKKIEEKEE